MTTPAKISHGIHSVAYLKLFVIISIIVFAGGLPDTVLATQHNRPCKRSWDGATGICVPLSECPNPKTEGTSKIRRPDLCKHQGHMPIICCVPKKQPSTEEYVQALSVNSQIRDNSTRPKPLWMQKCIEYSKFVYEIDEKSGSNTAQCVQSNYKAAGRAKFGEFPHMAAVGYQIDNTIQFFCGGSLISERYVLTAAHCVIGSRSSNRPRWTLLGQVSLKETIIKYEQLFNASEMIEIPQLISVSQLIVHPDYKQNRKYFDVGLLQIAHSPRLGPYLRPACLSSGRTSSSLEFTVTGWGAQGFGGNSSNNLLKVTLLEAPFDECSESYDKLRTRHLALGLHRESMMCAGLPNLHSDSCQGDSGGPLQVKFPDLYCMYEVFGIVSFGKGCGNGIPGVYTRVEYFRTWIEDIVWN